MSGNDQIEAFRSHWWWRPGWGVGTRYYAWHLTFDDQPTMRTMAASYQVVLGSVPALDPVPLPWLHLTTQGVGHAASVATEDLDGMVKAVRTRLAALPRPASSFGPCNVTHEGIQLAPADREPLRAVHRQIQQGMADVLGAGGVPGYGDTFWPHVSLAYANNAAPTAPVREALSRLAVPLAEVTFDRVSLIKMHRDHQLYEWEVVTTACIGH